MAVVILGHGDSPKGCLWGTRIDQHTVIRLKDPSWQSKEDYGKRCDYMVASTETMQVMLDYKRVPREYWAQPKRGHWDALGAARFRERAKAPLVIPLDIHEFWSPIYQSLAEDLKLAPNHSLGTAAITYAAQFLAPEKILLVGFDNLLDPERLDYYKANKGKWVSRHDWQAENALLPKIEAHYQVKIERWASATA